jgi:monofunctional biosynthetic peptidoglycan transglycosylase
VARSRLFGLGHVFRVVRAAPAVSLAVLGYLWLTTPDVRTLARARPGETAFMAMRAREAGAAGRRAGVRQTWVPLSQISPLLQRAVVVTEDAAFWDHTGVDLYEVQTALSEGLRDGEFRGASTITQQLAKNLYLSPSRNPTRKVVELFLARRLEAELSKGRILELYLNVVEWGDGIWGVEAASQAYFGVPAGALVPEEAALLAGALINPRVYNPARPNQRLLRRQEIILRRLQ